MNYEGFQSCIDACIACAIACEQFSIACLKQTRVNEMVRCIELSRECATICRAAAKLMSIEGFHATALCSICAEVCEACARECASHELKHCRECAEECKTCAEECRRMVELPV